MGIGCEKMKSTGIVRRIDQLGRITIPMETRNILGIKENDSLEIFTEDNMILLKKYQPSCIFCGNARDVITFKGQNVCPSCLQDMQKFSENI